MQKNDIFVVLSTKNPNSQQVMNNLRVDFLGQKWSIFRKIVPLQCILACVLRHFSSFFGEFSTKKIMASFKLTSTYAPTGDQPEAIRCLTEGVERGVPFQTLLGVTGSGKTFTMANVIANLNRPTLILSHNKTLASQLYDEFKSFFPENAVEYFVSYYAY